MYLLQPTGIITLPQPDPAHQMTTTCGFLHGSGRVWPSEAVSLALGDFRSNVEIRCSEVLYSFSPLT